MCACVPQRTQIHFTAVKIPAEISYAVQLIRDMAHSATGLLPDHTSEVPSAFVAVTAMGAAAREQTCRYNPISELQLAVLGLKDIGENGASILVYSIEFVNFSLPSIMKHHFDSGGSVEEHPLLPLCRLFSDNEIVKVVHDGRGIFDAIAFNTWKISDEKVIPMFPMIDNIPMAPTVATTLLPILLGNNPSETVETVDDFAVAASNIDDPKYNCIFSEDGRQLYRYHTLRDENTDRACRGVFRLRTLLQVMRYYSMFKPPTPQKQRSIVKSEERAMGTCAFSVSPFQAVTLSSDQTSFGRFCLDYYASITGGGRGPWPFGPHMCGHLLSLLCAAISLVDSDNLCLYYGLTKTRSVKLSLEDKIIVSILASEDIFTISHRFNSTFANYNSQGSEIDNVCKHFITYISPMSGANYLPYGVLHALNYEGYNSPIEELPRKVLDLDGSEVSVNGEKVILRCRQCCLPFVRSRAAMEAEVEKTRREQKTLSEEVVADKNDKQLSTMKTEYLLCVNCVERNMICPLFTKGLCPYAEGGGIPLPNVTRCDYRHDIAPCPYGRNCVLHLFEFAFRHRKETCRLRTCPYTHPDDVMRQERKFAQLYDSGLQKMHSALSDDTTNENLEVSKTHIKALALRMHKLQIQQTKRKGCGRNISDKKKPVLVNAKDILQPIIPSVPCLKYFNDPEGCKAKNCPYKHETVPVYVPIPLRRRDSGKKQENKENIYTTPESE